MLELRPTCENCNKALPADSLEARIGLAAFWNEPILEREFPRAVHACVARAEESLRAVSGMQGGAFRNTAEQSLGGLRSDLEYAKLQDIVADGVHTFLTVVEA